MIIQKRESHRLKKTLIYVTIFNHELHLIKNKKTSSLMVKMKTQSYPFFCFGFWPRTVAYPKQDPLNVLLDLKRKKWHFLVRIKGRLGFAIKEPNQIYPTSTVTHRTILYAAVFKQKPTIIIPTIVAFTVTFKLDY